ncbi:hypothetical protein SAMN05216276_110615 [Streptosporangium subroseum]|uniref:Uncharacterized protein n=1 Tax=Streptosporangium subroseum TaxID=106412 RepID=A0A239PAD7_9ACTN|nr:hypothetical protein [Streptosporangium subroseum]SNT63872.1 hypothetical protein SAMN05216276_110615 [Streptosporangium subroseum]
MRGEMVGEAADGMVGETVGEAVGESSSLPQEEIRAMTARTTTPAVLADV